MRLITVFLLVCLSMGCKDSIPKDSTKNQAELKTNTKPPVKKNDAPLSRTKPEEPPKDPLVLADIPHGKHVFDAKCLGGRGTGWMMHVPKLIYIFEVNKVIKGKLKTGTVVPIEKTVFKKDVWLRELLNLKLDETGKLDQRVFDIATKQVGASRFNPGGGFTCTDKTVRLKIKQMSKGRIEPYTELLSCEVI